MKAGLLHSAEAMTPYIATQLADIFGIHGGFRHNMESICRKCRREEK